MTRGRELRDELVPRAAAVRERNITRPGPRMDAPCCFCMRSSLSPTDAPPPSERLRLPDDPRSVRQWPVAQPVFLTGANSLERTPVWTVVILGSGREVDRPTAGRSPKGKVER
jgi:hypothetical protein